MKIFTIRPGTYKAVELALVISSLLYLGCAGNSVRHVGTVTLTGLTGTLSLIVETEAKLVCGRPGAPPDGQCVTLEAHQQIKAKLSEALKIDADLIGLVRALPAGAENPPQIGELLARATQLITDILALIPDGPDKRRLMSASPYFNILDPNVNPTALAYAVG